MTCQPDFVVLPDRVGAGLESLAFSMQWRERIDRANLCSVPVYLASQDGQQTADIPWSEIDGLFMGGTLEWKVSNARHWREAARCAGIPFHYARCGTRKRVAHALAIRADSIDSCLPLWSAQKCNAFLNTLKQETLFYEVTA